MSDKVKDPSAPAVHTDKKSATVTVGCKLPAGLVLHLDHMEKSQEPVMGGGFREVMKAVKLPQTYTLKGNAVPHGMAPSCPIVGGYALTSGIPTDFFDAWLEQNKFSDVVRNKLVIAHSQDTQGMSRELRATRSNLEPLVPDSDPRIPKSKTKNIQTVSSSDREAA